MAFKPSIYQQAVFDFIQKGRGNGVVEAVAGSGKTTTILQALQYIPSNRLVIFLAFNKDIATVLKERTREMGVNNVDCLTLNALGLRAWKRLRPSSKVDGNKMGRIARDIMDGLENQYSQTLSHHDESRWACMDLYFQQIVSLARKAKIAGLVPANLPGATGLIEDTTENWETLIEHYDIEFDEGHAKDEMCIRLAQAILRKACSDLNDIDFDDMFYFPLIFRCSFDKPDFLFIDEAQDVSDIQREILSKCMGPSTRLIAIGDPCQSIYGFRGSNPDSLGLIATKFNATRLPLSISYRCAKSVVEEAKTIVSHIEASATAPNGQVTNFGDKFSFKDFNSTDMIVCRNTAPLVAMAYALITNKIPCKVKGRDIGAGLVKLIEKMKATTVEGLKTKLAHWVQKETARLTKKDPDADTTSVTDKAETLNVFMASSKATQVTQLIEEIKALFSKDDNANEDILTLSTIHKSKGLEAKRVWFLNRSLLPSKHAKSPWALAQENNLVYVAITRAKEALFYIEVDTKKNGFSAQASAMASAAPIPDNAPAITEPVEGQKWTAMMRVVSDRETETPFGVTTLVKLQATNGKDITWFSKKGVPNEMKGGCWVNVEAEVSKLEEFRGTPCVRITRVKVLA